jgi:hypothetical protein
MKISVFLVGAALIPLSATALAARPAVYPLRSQSAETQGADNAFCYWQAKQQTGVDMTRQSQRPVRTKTRRAAADAGAGASEPPLPAAHGKSDGVSQAAGGESSTVEAGGASASSTQSIAASGAQSSAVGGSTAHAAAPSSGAPGVASSAVGSSPPLPPPEPPMTVYWQAFGDCMRSRGYGVQ